MENGQEVNCLSHSGEVDALAYSHDGTLLAAGDGRDRVRIWNRQKLQEVDSHSLHSTLIFSVCFSPDDHFVASGDQAGRIVVWDTTARDLWWEIASGHKGVVNGLRFVKKGQLLASCAEDGTVKLWGIQERSYKPVMSEGVEDDLHVNAMKIAGAGSLSDARRVISELMNRIDLLLVGGLVAKAFIEATRRGDKSMPANEEVKMAATILDRARWAGIRIVVPTDVVVRRSGYEHEQRLNHPVVSRRAGRWRTLVQRRRRISENTSPMLGVSHGTDR